MVFCPFPLIDVDREAVPLNDLPVGITQRFTHRMMPSVLSICTSIAVYHVERLSSFDCPEECLRGLLSIIRMNESLPPAINEFFEGSPTIFKKSLREMIWLPARPRRPKHCRNCFDNAKEFLLSHLKSTFSLLQCIDVRESPVPLNYVSSIITEREAA